MAKKTSSTVTKTKKAGTVADDASVVDQVIDAGEVVGEAAVVKKTRAPRKKAAASVDGTVKKPAVKRTRRRIDSSEASSTPVMKAYWGVFNPMMVQVAQYNYSEESEAQKAAADLTEKKKAPHFVQIIKKIV